MYRKRGKRVTAVILAVILMFVPCDQIHAVLDDTDTRTQAEEFALATEEVGESTDVVTEDSTERTSEVSKETEESDTEKSNIEESNIEESDIVESDIEETESEESEIDGTDLEEMEDQLKEPDSEATEEIENSQIELEEIRERVERRFEEDGYVISGMIDAEFEAERASTNAIMPFNADIPTRYSAVEKGQVSSIRNQGNWNNCWSFAAVCTAECGYKSLYGQEADLSESHLTNFLYNSEITGPDGGLEGDGVIPLVTDKVNNGGNAAFTTFALARWTGIADEALDNSLVYPLEYTYTGTELNISSEYAYRDVVHLQNAYWIASDDRNAIKNAIIQNGSVAIGYKYNKYRDSEYVTELIGEYKGPAVYYNEQKNLGSGHAVAIVGWDDEFPRENFLYTFDNQENIQLGVNTKLPQNNGAWLIKNSWGSEYGDDGYFWMSYEDASLSDTVYAFDFEKADNYDHIYQYDGSVGTRYESGDRITTAAVYKSNGNQMLEAVGVGIASVETDYTVEIYKNLSDLTNPQSGQLVSTVEGHTTFQGYHTIKLDESVLLEAGNTFGVVVTLSNGKVNGQSSSAIFMDQSYDNGSAVRFIAKTNPGETFIKKDGQWSDVYETGTFRIKAYTSNYEHDIPQENIVLTLQMVQEIEDQEYSGDKNEPELVISYMGERLVRDVDYSVNYVNNDRVADRAGENAPKAIITGMGKYTGTVEQTFTILPKTITEEMVETTSLMYDGSVQDDLKVIDDTVQLVKGTDYTISFSKQPCNAGTYQAEVTGKGNYTGTLQLSVTIGKTTLNDEMIIVPATVEYAGKAIKPQVKVCVNGKELPAASFSVSYKNNTNAGTAVVTVTGKGGCQGKVEKNFTILPRDISENLSVVVAKATYTGKNLTPSVTVKCDGRSLRKGTDYTVTYENNRAAGENAAVTITGKGNYTGVFGQTFTIFPKELTAGSIGAEIGYGESGSMVRVLYGKTELSETDCSAVVYRAGTSTAVDMSQLVLGEKYDVEITLKGNYRIKNAGSTRKTNIVCRKSVADLTVALENGAETFTYNGKAQKPKLIVREQSGTEVPKSNYTISYVDNINAGTATAVVTGKGAYAGTKKLEFTIQRQQLDNLTIQQVKDQTYAQKVICPAIKVMDGKKTLKSGAGKDYVCTYANNVDVSYDNGNVIAGAYAEIQLSDNYAVPEGTNLRVYFKILPAKITSLTLSKAHYTGEAVLPDNIVVKAGKLVVPLESYEVTANNNVNVSGSAVLKVTAKAQSNYTGSLSKKYSIVKQELKKCILPEIPEMPYLGQPVDVSGFALKQQNGEEIGSDQYTITVKNNTKPGKATMTYVAKNDSLYRGSVSIRFNIVKGTVGQAIDWDTAKAIEKPYTGKEITLTEEEIRQLAPIKAYTGAGNPPYTVTYAKNTNAGKASVKLTGKDYLQGSATVYFTITPKSVSSLKITTGEKQLSYNGGTPVYLELNEVTDGDQVLKAGKDYTYSYTNADKKGTACLTVTGGGNYTGTRYIYYKIN